MTSNSDDSPFDPASLDASLAALAAAPPPPLSEDFLRRVAADARRAHADRGSAVQRFSAAARRDPLPALRRARDGLRAGFAAGAIAVAASAALGFFAGWADLADVGASGFADADLLSGEAVFAVDWEDTL